MVNHYGTVLMYYAVHQDELSTPGGGIGVAILITNVGNKVSLPKYNAKLIWVINIKVLDAILYLYGFERFCVVE